MRQLLILCSIVLFTFSTALAFDSESERFLKEARRVKSSDQIAEILDRAPGPWSAKTFWIDAVKSISGSGKKGFVDHPAVVRLMEAALIRTGTEADKTPLDHLSGKDIASMRKAIAFPDPCDILLYILNRGPSLLMETRWGEYVVQRYIVPGEPVRIREWSNQDFMGIGPDGRMTFVDEKEDSVCKVAGEYAKTRRLHLQGLPGLIVAAKAFRAAERAQETVVYPLLIASYAVNELFRNNPTLDFRSLVYFVEQKTTRALRNNTARDPFIEKELREREDKLPNVAFEARLFEEAAEAYARTNSKSQDRHAKTSAVWGQAISLFAYGADEAGAEFDRVAALVDADTPYFASILGMLVLYLPADEAELLGDSALWRHRLAEILGPDWDDIEKLTEVVPDSDFLSLMLTIGRPDIANRFLMDKLRLVKGTTRENYLFRELAAFARDYCYVISFRLSPSGGWIRREARGYNALLDFVDNFNSEGRLVGRGEVVVSDGSYVPYPALSPEEDCATSFVAYGVISEPFLQHLDEAIRQNLTQEGGEIVRGFEQWVRKAMSRLEPSPSIVPYLKLVFQEWFSQAFEFARSQGFEASKFRYKAVEASELTTIERVEELRRHAAATPHHRNLIQLFLDTRMFLEEMYP